MYSKGTLIWANGDVYEDRSKDDVRHVMGKMTKESGGMYRRIYNCGERLSSKPFVTLFNSPPSQRFSTNNAVSVVILNKGDTTCHI